jgi:hypothetical protein
MRFGITFIAAIALVFACIVSAAERNYTALKTAVNAGNDKDINDELAKFGPTMLTSKKLIAIAANPVTLDALLLFDERYQKAMVTIESIKSSTDKKEAESKFLIELGQAEEAFKALGDENRADFKDKMSLLTQNGEVISGKKTTPFYKNPLYITIAVIVILVIVVCIWAIFFRKKAEDL